MFIQTSMNKEFIEARKLDIGHIKTKLKGQPLFETLSKRWKGKEGMKGMSDIFDSLSLGKFHDKYNMPGHGSRYYNAKSGVRKKHNKSKQQSEIFAQLFEAWASNGESWKEALEFFPNQSKELERIMKGLL